ncbi:MAG TPA: TetR family transcriptional regulator [Micromonosporaceae bacterium]|nr:TetR family transcriptional regulator [Micromonosporaceae bacterium]
MGHREQLLEGAKRCLAEKGYERTTARDIVAASGTNLASIGYHFGSKEALLTQAMIEVLGEWGDEVARLLATTTQAGPMARLESMWTVLLESFQAQRGVWLASFEIGQVAERVPELKSQLSAAYNMARIGLASLFLGVSEEDIDPATAKTVGSFLLAIIPGLTAQWMLDPNAAPSGHDMALGLERIVKTIAPEPFRGNGPLPQR